MTLEEKIEAFKTTLQVEYIHCIENNLETEAKTLEYIINEWNEIFN